MSKLAQRLFTASAATLIAIGAGAGIASAGGHTSGPDRGYDWYCNTSSPGYNYSYCTSQFNADGSRQHNGGNDRGHNGGDNHNGGSHNGGGKW